jgi:hypothetical protein
MPEDRTAGDVHDIAKKSAQCRFVFADRRIVSSPDPEVTAS